jgi:hypothetical protein
LGSGNTGATPVTLIKVWSAGVISGRFEFYKILYKIFKFYIKFGLLKKKVF